MWFFLSFFPAKLIVGLRGLEEVKNPAGKSPPPDSDPFSGRRALKESHLLVKHNRRSMNRLFEFQKCRQLFVGVHNETLSIAAICVANPSRSPLCIHG